MAPQCIVILYYALNFQTAGYQRHYDLTPP